MHAPLPSQGRRSHFTRLPGSLPPACSLALSNLAGEKKVWPPSLPSLPPLPTWWESPGSSRTTTG